MRFLKYIAIFLLGFLLAKFWYESDEKNYQKEEIQVVLNSIKNLSKLVVTEGAFSEVYNYSDSKKYFYEFLSFNKKAIVTVNAKVEVGYNLANLEIEIDSLAKKIIIHKIPSEEILISPDVQYFDLQQSQFNSFSKEELNTIHQKSVAKIKETIEVSNLKRKAKERLLEELSKIYVLSSVYNWEVEDRTASDFLKKFTPIKE